MRTMTSGMSYFKGQRPGDKVYSGGYTAKGRVVKIKPDGTKIVRDRFGSLKHMRAPDKVR